MRSSAIALDGLTKVYGRTHRGISDVTLRVDVGEIFGFIGPNGAGKSTTIRLLLGMIKPTSGSARIFDEPVTVSAKRFKSGVGYLPSEVRYYGDMKVGDLLRYDRGFYPNRPYMDISCLAEHFNVDLAGRIADLSLGNRKKVGILQAILHRPRLLIMDEPTSGLDPLMQNRFFDLLHDLNAGGTTIFFSSHVLPEVERLCHRVAILKEGRVVALEGIEALRSHSVKKVSIEWARKEDVRLPEGATNVSQREGRASFLFQGSPQALLEDMARHSATIRDVTIEQPSLDEVFLHYYGTEGI